MNQTLSSTGHHGDKVVHTAPVGLLQGAFGNAAVSVKQATTLAQRINDKINRLQGQVEELQLLRGRLQAGKLDQLTMDDLGKLWDY